MKNKNLYLAFLFILGFTFSIQAQDFTAIFNSGIEKIRVKDYDGAIKDFTEVIRLKPNNPSPYLNRGICYYFKRAAEPARSYKEEADIYAKLKPGEVPPKSQNSLNAIADLTKAIQLGSSTFAPYYYRGWIYQLEKDLEPAINDLQKAIELKPDFEQDPQLKGLNNTIIKTRNDHAQQLYMRALNISIAVTNIAETEKLLSGEKLAEAQRSKEQRKADARNLFLKVTQISRPNDFLSLSRRAGAYENLENWNLALADLNEMLKARPDDLNTINKRANVYLKMGQTETAVTELGRVISRTNVAAGDKFYQSEALVNRAKIYADQGKLNEALADLNKAIVKHPTYLYAYLERGKVHAKKGNKPLARADLIKAKESSYLVSDAQEQIDILDGKIKPKTQVATTPPTNANSSTNFPDQLVWRKTDPADIVNQKQILGFNGPNGKLNFLCRAEYAGGVHPGIVLANKCNIGYAGKAIVLEKYEIYLTSDNPNFELIAKEGEKYVIGKESNGTPLYLCYLNYQNWWLPGKIVNGNCNYIWQGVEYYSTKFNYGFVAKKGLGGTNSNVGAADSHFQQGNTYLKAKNYTTAIKEFEKALELNPKLAEAAFNLGLSYNGLSVVDKNKHVENIAIANTYFRKALSIDPKHELAYQHLGINYYGSSDLEDALASYNKAIEINPNNGDNYSLRSMVYKELGQPDKAAADQATYQRLKASAKPK